MGKVYTRFQTRTAQKTILFNWGAHTYMAYIKEYPPRNVCKGQPHFLSCQFLSKYTQRLSVLSLIWLPWLVKITCMHPNEHCYRERQPGDVSILLSRDKWSRKIKNKSNKNWGILPIKQLCVWNGGAWDITVKWCIWLVQRYKSCDLGKCAVGCGCLEKPFKSHWRYVMNVWERSPSICSKLHSFYLCFV